MFLKSVMILSALAGFNAVAFGQAFDFGILTAPTPEHSENWEEEAELTCDNLVETLQRYERATKKRLAQFPLFVDSTATGLEGLSRNCSYRCRIDGLKMGALVEDLRETADALTEENSRREKRMDALLLKLAHCVK